MHKIKTIVPDSMVFGEARIGYGSGKIYDTYNVL